jgi:hypothetical protein
MADISPLRHRMIEDMTVRNLAVFEADNERQSAEVRGQPLTSCWITSPIALARCHRCGTASACCPHSQT